MRAIAAVRAAGQPLLGVDSYLLAFGGIAAVTAIALLMLMVRGHRRSGLRIPRTRTEELLALLCALSVGTAGLHELFTDRLCHGSCL